MALLCLFQCSSLPAVIWLLLFFASFTVPSIGLQCVFVTFSCHIHLQYVIGSVAEKPILHNN